MDRSPAVLVVPIRSFAHGNTRLTAVLDAPARADFARTLAAAVLDAAGGLATIVVTSDTEVAAWAQARGATVLADPGSLDGAARAGAQCARDRGAARFVVAHADLPFAHDLDTYARDGSEPVAVLVPDQRRDGTPVLSLPAAVADDFTFSYGPGSFGRHLAVADALGLTTRVVADARVGFDVDDADDFGTWQEMTAHDRTD